PGQVNQVIHPPGRQGRRPRHEVVIPHRLVEDVAVAHLRAEGRLDLLPGRVLITLRITGIDQVAVGETPPPAQNSPPRPAQGRQPRHESVHRLDSPPRERRRIARGPEASGPEPAPSGTWANNNPGRAGVSTPWYLRATASSTSGWRWRSPP